MREAGKRKAADAMDEDQVMMVRIRKVDGRYGVTIDTGEGIVLEEGYYKPQTSAEVGKLIEMWLDGLEE